jgi:benzylsuccinate CoA-transferase BbsE subunit
LSAEVRSTIDTGRPDAPLEYEATHASALTGLRVIDMSGMAGQYCGKRFADLGAEVILVEPPGGYDVKVHSWMTVRTTKQA